jgi:hypothetical protein
MILSIAASTKPSSGISENPKFYQGADSLAGSQMRIDASLMTARSLAASWSYRVATRRRLQRQTRTTGISEINRWSQPGQSRLDPETFRKVYCVLE